ncbi:hypothetical protein HQ489_04420 [Candidatus Woesearchaeota archaeon]|nr:hypothetical protein [Candidatus Woesearchaeota archaeon]
MVDVEEFKKGIRERVSQDYGIEFLGHNFDKIVNLLTDEKTETIYQWIQMIFENNPKPIYVKSKKTYKQWPVSKLLTFRYPFSINNTEYRILFVKVKNEIYIEFHLGDHKYYDKVRKDLFVKESEL